MVGARTDHLTAWKACYATTQLMGGTSQFALSSSGHIQSLVNPPGNPRMTVATAEATDADPDEWLAKTHGGHRIVVGALGRVGRGPLRRTPPGTVVARAVPRTPPGDAAPGRYVLAS